MKQNFYFTYGTSTSFPFQNGYTKVIAQTRATAIRLFQMIHPNQTENVINCAFIYSEKEFENTVCATQKCHETIEGMDGNPVRNLC